MNVTLPFPVLVHARRIGRAGKACLAGLKWILRAAGFFKVPDKIPDRRELGPPPKYEWPDLIRPFVVSSFRQNSAAAAGPAAGVALHAGAVADEGEVSAGTACVAFVALHAGFGGTFRIDF